LGNPGPRYRETRHNLGFRVVDELARRTGRALDRLECNARVTGAGEPRLAEPMTYMNRSGYSVRCLAERQALAPEEILVVYDDIWLPLGRLRARGHGGPGGHRGMESVLENLRTERVPRLRMGVGWEGGPPAGVDLVEYVTEPFAEEELSSVEAMVSRAADACELWLGSGVQTTMDRFNA
jgi:PTH1 family peptidyl-tRNA hydrolase